MKTNCAYLTFLVFALFLITSCKDFIEPDIGGKQINTLAPGNLYQSKSYTINFWWDGLENASAYRLQIVTPKFDTIGALIADTLVKSNKFAINIEPGTYQWRVRAENGSTQTPYSALKSFTVLPSSIKLQTVILASPADNSLVNIAVVNFEWGTLYGATRYRLQVDTNSFSDTSRLLYNKTTPDLQVAFSFPKDQQYQWRVRAENDTAQSKWSAIRSIRYDNTPPGQVALLSPANNKVVILPLNLQWGPVTTASRYKLYLLKADSTTNYGSSFPVFINTTNYTFNPGTSGERIYWKVSAFDAAGNEGQVSKMQNFVLP